MRSWNDVCHISNPNCLFVSVLYAAMIFDSVAVGRDDLGTPSLGTDALPVIRIII